MRGRFGQVERLDVVGDRADKALANGHPGDVNGFLRQAARGKKFEHAFAQQVDRAHLAVEALADNFNHRVQLGLRVIA